MNDFDKIIDRRATGSEKWEKYAGRDVIAMWVADMDFQAPPAVLAALHEHIDHGVLGYANATDELNDVICNMLQVRYGWSIEPEWLVWLPGLVTALNISCRAVGQSGDEVASFTPIYPPFLSAPHWSDRSLLTVPLIFEGDRWRFDLERLKKTVTPKTKLLLLCNPHNPVGRVFSDQEIEEVSRFCLEHDIVVCSDEVHCDLILDDLKHKPTANISEPIAQNTITLMAPSKTYNLPGLGCSFAIIPNTKLRKQFLRAKRGIVPHVNALGYTACMAAFRDCDVWRNELVIYLRQNRDLVEQFVRDHLSPCRVSHVEATYLAWINIRQLELDDAEAFFEQFGVGLSGGHWYQGKGYIRLNFGCPREVLQQGLNRMKTAIESKLKQA
jgi:cystathionine beta-lyase